MVVKWRGFESEEKMIPGGGRQGAYLGNLEYSAQSNDSANCVKQDSRFKFVDDLTTLEKYKLTSSGDGFPLFKITNTKWCTHEQLSHSSRKSQIPELP